jgi:hypothetical protein
MNKAMGFCEEHIFKSYKNSTMNSIFFLGDQYFLDECL